MCNGSATDTAQLALRAVSTRKLALQLTRRESVLGHASDPNRAECNEEQCQEKQSDEA